MPKKKLGSLLQKQVAKYNANRQADLDALNEARQRVPKGLAPEDEMSPCCSAPIILHDLCSECKEHI